MSKISVLIPCHNASIWISDSVRSISAQTHKDLEILIYNDGSTDGSEEIIERLAATDPRIIPLGESTNRGIVHALNTMLHKASGGYIARMDADDISLPQRLERQLRFLEEQKIDLCGTWLQEFGGGIPRPVRWHTSPQALKAAMLFQNTICHPTIMAKREVFEQFQYRSEYNLAEDYDIFVRALSKFKLANMPEVLLRYRRHPQQATKDKRSRMEQVTCKIRLEALRAQGISASQDEQRIHNLIRAPRSIFEFSDLENIEQWLLKLLAHFSDAEAKSVVASQWTRAAVRAAPLGWSMWKKYRKSPLYAQLPHSNFSNLDIATLAITRIDYGSRTFEALRRFGLSA